MSTDMHGFIGQKVLVTTSDWFFAPDGRQYRAVWGTLHAVTEAKDAVGFVPNRAHANWFILIGNMVIMGCQVLFYIRADEVHTGSVNDNDIVGGEAKSYTRMSPIYVAE